MLRTTKRGMRGMQGQEMARAGQVLDLAQQTADAAIADAQREAEQILARARLEADRIIADAQKRAHDV